MAIVLVPPSDRFDAVALEGSSTWPLATIYSCPRCGAEVSFSKDDLFFRSRLAVSNLDQPVASEFDRFAIQSAIDGNGFLDWACPTCSLPARVYVRTWVGGRHGDAGTDLVAVLETG